MRIKEKNAFDRLRKWILNRKDTTHSHVGGANRCWSTLGLRRQRSGTGRRARRRIRRRVTRRIRRRGGRRATRRGGRRLDVLFGFHALLPLAAVFAAMLDALVLLGVRQVVAFAVHFAVWSVSLLAPAEASLLILPIAHALLTVLSVRDVDALAAALAALGTAGLGAAVGARLAVVLLAAVRDAFLVIAFAMKATVGLLKFVGEFWGGCVVIGDIIIWVSTMVGGGPKVVTFPVVTRKNEEDSRSTEQRSKEPKQNLHRPRLPGRRQDYSAASDGGCCVRRPLGQRWPGSAELRSQDEASFFCWPKIRYKVGDLR